MPAEVSDRELRLLRLRAQRLLPGSEAESVAAAARSCFTIQAQDAPAAALALRARIKGLTAESVRAQAADGEVCRAWLMRNTIHLFASEDLSWMRPLLAERPLRPAMTRFGSSAWTRRRSSASSTCCAGAWSGGPCPAPRPASC